MAINHYKNERRERNTTTASETRLEDQEAVKGRNMTTGMTFDNARNVAALERFLVKALQRRWPQLEPLWLDFIQPLFEDVDLGDRYNPRIGLVGAVFAPLVAELWSACAQELITGGAELLAGLHGREDVAVELDVIDVADAMGAHGFDGL